MENRWERFAPLSGVVAVVLWVTAIVVMESGSVPVEDATAADVLRHFTEDSGSILIGATLFGFGCMAFLWFLGSVRVRLLAAEGPVGRLTAIAFGGGLAAAIGLLATMTPQVGAAIAVEDGSAALSPEGAQAMWYSGDGFFLLSELFCAVFFFALALTSLRHGAFPKWVAWIAVVLGVVMLIPPIGWAALIWGMPLWTLAVSIWMFRAQAPAPAGALSASA